MTDLLFFNGINGATGDYGLPPMTAQELSTFIQGEAEPDDLAELRHKYQDNTAVHFGIKERVDPKDLQQSGWGAIFAHDADPALQEALSPLLKLRQEQAGERYRLYEKGDGFRVGKDTKGAFLARHGTGPGPADPDKVPYYLLIVGSPQKIPYRFQSQLDVQYAVGRIDFGDDLDAYENYAKSVVAAETGQVKLSRQVSFFGVANPDDPATNLSADYLASPLVKHFRENQRDWKVNAFLKDQARKDNLQRLLGGDQTPALLFTASHGMEFPMGDARQIPHQGALLCQDWPGPEAWSGQGAIPQEFYFAGDDLPSNANLLGLLSFFFACYGGGTPRVDEFAKLASRSTRDAIAPYDFLAALPTRMLSNPGGGALAVIGHVERAWGYSFVWEGAGPQTTVFESTLDRLLGGHPVGSAVEYLNERYAELSTVLADELEEMEFGKQVDPYELAGMWTANNDARGYVIIGDPAVRLPVAATQEEVKTVPDIRRLTPIPSFIMRLRSDSQQERSRGVEEAMQIIEMATKAYEQLEEEGITEEDLAREDREAVKNQRVLRDETFRLIDIVKEGKDTDRVNALLVLEKLGPLAKTEAMHILRHGALHDPDENIRSQMVRTIAAIETNQPSLMSELRKLLRDGSPSVRWEVLHVLKGTKPAPKEMLSELWPLSTDPDLGSEVLEAIASIQDDKPHFISEVLDRLQRGDFRDRQTRMVIGRHFLEEDEAISMAWDESRENKTQILEMVLEMLTAEDALERKEASDWLIKRENEIPGELLDSVVRELKQQSRTRDDWAVDSEVLNLTERLMERKRAERNLLLRDLRDEDSSVQIEAIKRAAETDDEWALRILIQEWVQWIASGQGERIQLVEEAAEKMRHNPLAVLPLVNQLSQEFQPSEQLLRAAPSASETLAQMPAEHAATSEKYSDVEVLRAKVETILKNELDAREWNIHQRILRQLTDRKNIKFDEEAIRKDILALINTEFKERELRVHQRIARQLADMSNPNFFKEGTEAPPYQAMRLSLEDYAVPILARLLPAAADDEIRKNLAYTLGNVGGREAVDALSRAVVGEERTRANRQKLLAEYYLDPSRQRSDEASEILKGAVKEAKRTLWFQQGLNIIVFVAGLGILIGGLLIAIRSQDAATQVAGILAGLGGFGGVIVQLVKNPLDRIQNAMANLVQIETAFTSFIWELNLNGTYIQSQYVAEGILTDDDIAQTISRIENAMNLTMDQVAVYTDRGRQLLVPNITSLSPVIGTSGTTISIFGQNLTRHKNQNQNGGQRLAIAVNHVPVLARDLGKKDSVIDFELPPELPTSLNITDGTIWISLIIDGRETNALPFQLVEK